MRVTSEAEQRLSALPQFQGIPTGALLRLVKLKTGLIVTSCWTAISLLLANRCPIPVMKGRSDAHAAQTPEAELIAAQGRYIAELLKRPKLVEKQSRQAFQRVKSGLDTAGKIKTATCCK